ncbi:hypothetical protein Y032_0004g2151 [Ancylostoma ceylanicum]|uniref:Uncharacterized protein n=1 Tax=Ancylostoma ceylanicum TaxID=53326 RepID=A0A016VXD6_9BILA|nr:hypothetical protein Y032_0004g2151 [Ancylostoma ceylanicum]
MFVSDIRKEDSTQLERLKSCSEEIIPSFKLRETVRVAIASLAVSVKSDKYTILIVCDQRNYSPAIVRMLTTTFILASVARIIHCFGIHPDSHRSDLFHELNGES